MPPDVRSRMIAGVNGMTVHIPSRPASVRRPAGLAVLLLHGFPELAYSWRKVMPALAEAGYHVIAPDQRGYGRTAGWDDSYDADPDQFRLLNMVRDAMGLVLALGYREVAAVAGHDAGSPVAAWSALIRPDVFHAVAMMSSPFDGVPSLPFDTANGAPPPARPMTDDEFGRRGSPSSIRRASIIATIKRPPGANDDMLHAPQGLHAFFRAYYHYKSADWPGNKPHPLKARTAAEMAQVPTYYVMERDKWRWPATVACAFHAVVPAGDRELQVAHRSGGRGLRDRVWPIPSHRRAAGLPGAARHRSEERCRDAHVLGRHPRRALAVHRGQEPTGAPTRRRAPRRACGPRPAPGWSASIWSTAPGIGCCRNRPRW